MAMRPATPADVDAIARVHVDTWRHAYRGQLPDAALDTLDVGPRQAMWQRILTTADHPARVFVAVDAATIVGFSACGPQRGDDALGELYALYVTPTAQGRGHGRQLLDAAEADLAARGYTEAVLWVLATNTPTIEFYEACGWRDDGVEETDVVSGVEVRDRRYRKLLR